MAPTVKQKESLWLTIDLSRGKEIRSDAIWQILWADWWCEIQFDGDSHHKTVCSRMLHIDTARSAYPLVSVGLLVRQCTCGLWSVKVIAIDEW